MNVNTPPSFTEMTDALQTEANEQLKRERAWLRYCAASHEQALRGVAATKRRPSTSLMQLYEAAKSPWPARAAAARRHLDACGRRIAAYERLARIARKTARCAARVQQAADPAATAAVRAHLAQDYVR